jgi:hypothetical protein
MSVIRGRAEETRVKPEVFTVEDLEVFRRAYAVLLELHKASLIERRIQALSVDGDWVCRRDAGLAEILRGSRIR